MDENRDRLIDSLLREELGGDHPPDLADRIVGRAFPQRRLSLRRFFVAASILFILGTLSWWLWPGYPEPRASGDFEVAGGGAVQRGSILRTRDKAATLELGGYSRIEIKPGSTVRIDGEKFDESVFLETGELHCKVERGRGSFAVRTAFGNVSVLGTEFTVEVRDEKGENDMIEKRVMVQVVFGAVLLAGAWGESRVFTGEQRVYGADDEQKPELKGGTVVGTLTQKKEGGWIMVKADGEESARRYFRFGDRPEVNKQIDAASVGSRVRIEWAVPAANEGPHIAKIEVLQAAGKADEKKVDEKKADDEKGGSVVGVVSAKETNWIEVKADGEEKARRYTPKWVGGLPKDGGGLDKTTLSLIAKTPVGARVKLDWVFEERPRVVKLEILGGDKK
jgi:hypothetical protein